MIPIRLELRNFLPYRAPDPIKFDGIHLACLTGPNGAGKSSVLDAITWALWGKARGRDDELIHQGQDEMYVQLDFVQEGDTYRVLRKRARAKRSSTGTLDLFRWTPDGTWKLDNEPSMRATQARINALLRLDYETFTHSAFLQQGKADAFTTQTPAERKRILSDILGLDQWAAFEERAKEKLKAIEQGVNFCDQRIREIEADLAREPALAAELEAARSSHAQAEALLATAQEQMKALQHVAGELKHAQASKSEMEAHLRRIEAELAEVRVVIERQQKQIADYQAVIAQEAEIAAGYQALREAREVDEALGDKLVQLRGLDEMRADLTSQLSAARARLQTEAEALRRNLADSQRLIDSDPSAELDALQAELSNLHSMEAQRDDLLRKETTLKEERAALKITIQTVEAEGRARGERVTTLESTDSPICPLCGQELTEEHRASIIAELIAERDNLREQWRQGKERERDINTDLKQCKAALDTLEADLKRLPALNEQTGKLSAQVDAAAQAVIRVQDDSARLAEVEAALASDDFAPDVREALARLDAEQHALGYDQTSHDDARQSLKDYQRFEQLWSRLEMAREALPQWEEMLSGSQKRQATLTEDQQTRAAQIDALAAQIAHLQVQDEEFRRREEEVRALHTQEKAAFERMNNAQQNLLALSNQREQKAKYEEQRIALRQQEALYKELRTAFSKNGVPAMIIETAIPELERTANDLLARMTDGRMTLRLLTQREKITGGTAETLEIEIADELGTRNYEMYSGGEAFRINFAVRVALSQLLARRAGAQLRTLFIDEGFGTQDDTGRNKLIEAITAIQEEFALILVITHIDELRDSFPVHIVVDKTASGSRISLR